MHKYHTKSKLEVFFGRPSINDICYWNRKVDQLEDEETPFMLYLSWISIYGNSYIQDGIP